MEIWISKQNKFGKLILKVYIWDMFDKLFKFPIVMIDMDNEEQKKNLTSSYNKVDMDIIIGEAEVPYYELISMMDRWIPNQDGLDLALEGDFNACFVNFGSAGMYLVPWPKRKFKEEYTKFVTQYNKKMVDTEEKLIDMLKDLPESKNQQNESESKGSESKNSNDEG